MYASNQSIGISNKQKQGPSHMRKSSVPTVMSTVPSFSVAETRNISKYNSKKQEDSRSSDTDPNTDALRDMISRKFEMTLEKHLEKLVRNQSNPNLSGDVHGSPNTARFNDSSLSLTKTFDRKASPAKVPLLDLHGLKNDTFSNKNSDNEIRPLSTVAEVSEKLSNNNSECSSQCDNKSDSMYKKIEEERLESLRQIDDLKVLKDNIKELASLVSNQHHGIFSTSPKKSERSSPAKESSRDGTIKYPEISKQQEINKMLRQRILSNLVTDNVKFDENTDPLSNARIEESKPSFGNESSSYIEPPSKSNLNIKINESDEFQDYNPFHNRLSSPEFIHTPEKPSLGSDFEDYSRMDSYLSGEKSSKIYNPAATAKYRKVLFDSDVESSNNASYATGAHSRKGHNKADKMIGETNFQSSRLEDSFSNLINLIKAQNKGNQAIEEHLTKLNEIHGLEIIYFQQQIENLNQRIKVEKANQKNLIKSLQNCEREMDVLSSNNNSLSEIMLKYQESMNLKDDEHQKEIQKIKEQVDQEIIDVKANYEKLLESFKEETKRETHQIRQEYECKLIAKKREYMANEDKYHRMNEYSKACEESISAINLTLRKLISKASYKYSSPTLYDVLSRIIAQTSKFVENLDSKTQATEVESKEKSPERLPSSRRLSTAPADNLYDQYLSSNRESLIKGAQTTEKRLRIEETVSLNPQLEKRINHLRCSPERSQNFYIVKVPSSFTHRRIKSESKLETIKNFSDLSFHKSRDITPSRAYSDIRRSST